MLEILSNPNRVKDLLEKGTEENPFTHGPYDGYLSGMKRLHTGKYCKCSKCGKVSKSSPTRDYWGIDKQPLLCYSCCGPYGQNDLPIEE